jgi:hypothetical protein
MEGDLCGWHLPSQDGPWSHRALSWVSLFLMLTLQLPSKE